MLVMKFIQHLNLLKLICLPAQCSLNFKQFRLWKLGWAQVCAGAMGPKIGWARVPVLNELIKIIIYNNNIRLLETTDIPQSLDNNVSINVNDGQSPPRQLRVSSLPTAVTRWGDKASTQLSRPSFELGCFDPKPSALPTAPPCLSIMLSRLALITNYVQ